MKMIDANVILRFLLKDNEVQAAEAYKVVSSGAFTNMAVIAEVVYVLQGVYCVPREQISNAIISLFEDISCADSDVITYGLNVYSRTTLDFVDCMMVGYQKVKDYDIFTFDKKLNHTLKSFEL